MRVLACAAILSLAGVSAFAADAPSSNGGPWSAVREACKADVEALCKGVEQGKGKIAACLKEHQDKVSQGCKDAIAKRQKERETQGTSSGGGSTPAN